MSNKTVPTYYVIAAHPSHFQTFLSVLRQSTPLNNQIARRAVYVERAEQLRRAQQPFDLAAVGPFWMHPRFHELMEQFARQTVDRPLVAFSWFPMTDGNKISVSSPLIVPATTIPKLTNVTGQ